MHVWHFWNTPNNNIGFPSELLMGSTPSKMLNPIKILQHIVLKSLKVINVNGKNFMTEEADHSENFKIIIINKFECTRST